MRKFLLLTFIGLLLLSMPLSAQRRGARALVVDPSFDFGFIPQNCKVAHTYWVDNLGTDTLRIFNVQPGCGCTKAPLQTFLAPPNDSLPIELVFDSGRRQREQNKGTKVTCNDPAKSLFNLDLRAWVFKEGEPTGPLTISKNGELKLTTDDLGKTFAVEVRNVSEAPVLAKLIDYPGELLTVEVPPEPIPAGKTAEIRVHVNKEIRQANYNKSFT
ncbi:MAG: DUF1573 domain-containing protein, partial [bacterium]